MSCWAYAVSCCCNKSTRYDLGILTDTLIVLASIILTFNQFHGAKIRIFSIKVRFPSDLFSTKERKGHLKRCGYYVREHIDSEIQLMHQPDVF